MASNCWNNLFLPTTCFTPPAHLLGMPRPNVPTSKNLPRSSLTSSPPTKLGLESHSSCALRDNGIFQLPILPVPVHRSASHESDLDAAVFGLRWYVAAVVDIAVQFGLVLGLVSIAGLMGLRPGCWSRI
ncbi:hypothetical protein BGW36DRAFT_428802 [Talaromyces proteolyticus]|uniref:Uncharacterized protein n=1 Tax=Talaromyces proteolyticus TaxID=1131652 RepID=A0AAD4PY89_9EURO|nr:uncharacterized protein BGW36DRAFT_428802 [Talaromyces proteolyticus]KAH8694903.1 hypothetical protein BGW36DRAFT_428802 [Talaromyces proteolyticus]